MARSTVRFWFSIIVIPTFLVVAVLGYFAWRQSVPGVRAILEPVPRWIGVKTPLAVDLHAVRGGVRSVEIRLKQGPARVVLTKQAFTGPESSAQRIELVINGGTLGLREGGAVLEVRARDGFWRPIRVDDKPVASIPVTLDFTPPSVEVVSATRYWAKGGGGLVVVRSRGASRVAVGVGPLSFRAYPAGPADSNLHVAIVALPWNYEVGTPIAAIAQDAAAAALGRRLPPAAQHQGLLQFRGDAHVPLPRSRGRHPGPLWLRPRRRAPRAGARGERGRGRLRGPAIDLRQHRHRGSRAGTADALRASLDHRGQGRRSGAAGAGARAVRRLRPRHGRSPALRGAHRRDLGDAGRVVGCAMDPRPYRSAATRGEPAPHRVDHARAGEGAGRAAAPPSSGGRRAPALPADHENREPLARHLDEGKGAFHLALHDGVLVAPDRA